VRRRHIPNALAIAIGALGLVRMMLAGDPSAFLHTLAAGAAVFAAAFLLFWRGLVGGGDVKLLTAASLLVGYNDLLSFLFLMSLCGAVVSIAVIAGNKLAPSLDTLGLRPSPSCAAENAAVPPRPSVPYGVAIAAAGAIILIFQSTVPG
jgi:prepilin peptidase CpaA